MALISVPIYSYKKQAKRFSLSETGKKINFYRSLLLQRIKASSQFVMEQSDENRESIKDIRFLAHLTSKLAKFLSSMNEMVIGSLHHQPSLKSIDGSSEQDQAYPFNKIRGEKPERMKGKRLQLNVNEERPKGPTSSFLIYYHENKKELAKKFGSANVSKLTKMASLQWRSLPEEERRKYQKLSEESKERYQKEMEQYKQKYAEQIEEAMKKRRVEYRANWMRKKRMMAAMGRDQHHSDDSELLLSEQKESDLSS